MYNQNSDLMKQEKFMLPTMIEGDFSAEELAEDADGLQMSFQRVKIPAGGTLQFEMPSDDPDNPDYEKNLVGVILHNHATCAYWPAGSEYDDDTTPLCSSVDLGIGNGGFTNGVQVIVDDAIYERLTGKDTYSEFLPTLNEGADREIFDTFIEAFCDRTPGTTFLSYEESDQQLKESFAQIQMLAWGLILFVGLIGILNIINTVYTNIHTRVTEIGMQRAIGMSAGSLYKTFLWEGAYYGIIASVIGSVLGYVCTIFIEAATSDTIQLVTIPVMPILEATLLAVGACLLATAIPLRKISKMNIVDSIETVE